MIPRKPSAGEPIDYSARTQDQLIDSVEALRTEQFSQMPGELGSNTEPLGTVIKVENNSGQTVPQYGVLSISRPVNIPGAEGPNYEGKEALFKSTLFCGGSAPLGLIDHHPPPPDEEEYYIEYPLVTIGIAQEPINPDCVGDVMIDGVTQARFSDITADTTGLDWAVPIDGDVTRLELSSGGKIQVLFRDVSGWGVVRLGGRSVLSWVIAQQNWEHATEDDPHDKVLVKSCDANGIRAWGNSFYVFLPATGGRVPNIAEGDIFTVGVISDGSVVCTSDYLDEDFGTVEWWSGAVEDIREGWALCDGENDTVDLSDHFIMCTGENAVGATGGFDAHGPGENNHNDHEPPTTHGAPPDHQPPEPHYGDFRHAAVVVRPHLNVLVHGLIADHPDHLQHEHWNETSGSGQTFDMLGGVRASDPIPNIPTVGGDWIVNNAAMECIGEDWTSGVSLPHTPHAPINPHVLQLGHAAIQIPGHKVIMSHTFDGDHNDFAGDHNDFDGEHTTTDNRPKFYVLAAKQRVDNSLAD